MAVSKSKLELGQLRSIVESLAEGAEMTVPRLESEENMETDEQDFIKDFDTIVSQIAAEETDEISFFSNIDSTLYASLAESFCAMPINNANLARFSELPVLRKALSMAESLFLSFYIRLWCSNSPAFARAAALRTVLASLKEHLNQDAVRVDMQILFPYLIYALSDPSSSVRSAAADIVLILRHEYAKSVETMDLKLNDVRIYGANRRSNSIDWLSLKDSRRFVEELINPHLEECILDEQAVFRLLPQVLNGHHASNNSGKSHTELKKPSRLSIFSFLCGHTVNSPLYTFKLRMLRILNNVERINSISRTKLLLPVLFEVRDNGLEKLERICQREQISILDLVSEVTNIVTASYEEGTSALREHC